MNQMIHLKRILLMIIKILIYGIKWKMVVQENAKKFSKQQKKQNGQNEQKVRPEKGNGYLTIEIAEGVKMIVSFITLYWHQQSVVFFRMLERF